MRCLLAVAALLVISLGLCYVFTPDCSADVSFVVTAIVPSQAVIITNSHGGIIKILSNSTTPASLQVREGTEQGAELSLSSQILEQYNQITDNGTKDFDGVIYPLTNTHKAAYAKNSSFSLKFFFASSF
jgi:hypothetical protein